MKTYKVEVIKKYNTVWAEEFCRDLQKADHLSVKGIHQHGSFWLSGDNLAQAKVENYAKNILSDPVSEIFQVSFLSNPEVSNCNWVVEVHFRPGVTDNIARSATEAICIYEKKSLVSPQEIKESAVKVYSGQTYYMESSLSKEQVRFVAEKYFANPLVQIVNIYSLQEYLNISGAVNFPNPSDIDRELKTFDLSKTTLKELQSINEQRCLALNENELQTIKNYFSSSTVIEKREKLGIGAMLTEVELEALAQTWSEHCKHKIFAATIDYSEESSNKNIGKKSIKSLYKSYIQKATKEIQSEEKIDWLLSVFKDNAGIVRFADDLNICIKVETHNSPSALDPYGGALTGILGVNRDIIGTGLGAKPVANMDVFCLSLDSLFPKKDSLRHPVGLLQPSQIFRGVHKGVEDGGNQSGIPNINGAIQFSPNYSGKPLIYVGSVGVMPPTLADGRDSCKKEIFPGDRIVVAGGRLGKDGIHGATFSSMELNDGAPSTVVQIGDPITQKRLLDFTLKARDLGYIRAITDNGAGGVSSSIGEMAELSGGATLDLAKHPVKYLGLEYYEMLISESQERMSYAVDPNHLRHFLDLAQSFGVEAFDLGEFTDLGYFKVYYGDKLLACLDLEFMHDAVPTMELKAFWEGPKKLQYWNQSDVVLKLPEFSFELVAELLKKLLASPNIASKENWIRSYDHEVQAATHIKYFTGKSRSGPNNSGVLALRSYGSSDPGGVSVGCGLKPRLSHYDTYAMTEVAIDEAVRNLIAVGTNPNKIVLLDNFCWPDPIESASNPEGSHKLGQLVRSAQALYDTAKFYKTPFVSGKDSMKNDFKGKDQEGNPVKISVDPTLLITAMGKVEDLSKSLTSDFKQAGDLVYLISPKDFNWVGSELSEHYKFPWDSYEYMKPEVNYQIFNCIHELAQESILQSCHDVSDGGALVAVAESCFGNLLGVDVNLVDVLEKDLLRTLFAEPTGSFVVSIKSSNREVFESKLGPHIIPLGEVVNEFQLKLTTQSGKNSWDLSELFNIWKKGFDHAVKA